MGILSGALTVRRFRVVGDLHEGWRDVYRDRLNEFAFKDPGIDVGKEEIEGWVQVHNLLDTDFSDFNQWLYNDLMLFSLRVDKKSLPAKLFAATLQKRCEAWCAEKDVERCPSAVKTELKEELESEWLKRTLPRVAVTEACWNVGKNYVVLHSLSQGTAERFKKRFHRTFGHKLVPWSPLDWLPDQGLVEGMLATSPVSFGGQE